MMISCYEASRLSSLALEKSLSLKDRLALSFHLLICNHCKQFDKQIKKMSKVLCHKPSSLFEYNNGECLSSDCKDRIKEAIKKQP